MIGLLMQLASLSGAADPVWGLLLTVPFNATAFRGAPVLRAVRARRIVYFLLGLGAAYVVFRRRDITVS